MIWKLTVEFNHKLDHHEIHEDYEERHKKLTFPLRILYGDKCMISPICLLNRVN